MIKRFRIINGRCPCSIVRYFTGQPAFLVQGLPLVPIQKLLIGLPNSSIALWMCTKSQKDGQNHENTGIKRAIFHKCKMHFYRRFSHTGSTSHPFLNLKYRKWGPKISIWSPWFRTHNRAQNKYSYFDLRQAVNAKQVTKLWTLWVPPPPQLVLLRTKNRLVFKINTAQTLRDFIQSDK